MSITRFSNGGTGFGVAAVQRARAAGLSDAQIKQQVAAAGLTLGSAAAGALGVSSAPAPAAASWTPSMSNPLSQFANPNTGGFGGAAIARAKSAGFSDADIRALIPGSGITGLGPQAATALGLGDGSGVLSGEKLYASAFQASIRDYQGALGRSLEEYKKESEQRFEEEYRTRFETDFMQRAGDLQNQAMTLQSQLSTAEKERADAKAKADELEAQQKAEREMAVSEQLSSLRSGSTASGSAGSGLGSLTSGRSSYSVSTGAKSGGVLDRAYKDIDPTDSVLDKNVASAAAGQVQGSSTANRTQARQRALASGSAASDYYSRRFG
jgi:hypothetical protein